MSENFLRNIIIVGGGAGGFFAALRAAEILRAQGKDARIQIFEMSESGLKKVRISGGGRCNVTHNIFESRRFASNYPRGEKELLSPFQRFQAQNTVEWFEKRGVKLKAESDGRMFPVTDSSQTIIDCFLNEAKRLGVEIHYKDPVVSVRALEGTSSDFARFEVKTKNSEERAHSVLIATGSSSAGYDLARGLGHKITELAPSLFSFKIDHPLLRDLPGLSFSQAALKLEVLNKTFEEKGPLLITHWGLSGPALLKISAWAAREMQKASYQATLTVNFLGLKNRETVQDFLKNLKSSNPKSQLGSLVPEGLTRRFWVQLLAVRRIDPDTRWADLSNRNLSEIVSALYSQEFQITGKNRYKDEFVECGGVDLKEINFKAFESRIHPGLHFVGEILDIDGITGGFNFQNAWSGGFIAGEAMALWQP